MHAGQCCQQINLIDKVCERANYWDLQRELHELQCKTCTPKLEFKMLRVLFVDISDAE